MHWSRSLIGVNTCSVIMSVTQQISRTLSRQVKCTKCDNPLARLNNRVRLNIPNGFIICQSSTQAECSITIDRDPVDFFKPSIPALLIRLWSLEIQLKVI